MKASSYKRVLAYLIDTMIIVFISTIFTLVIPKSDNYEKASIELTDVMEKYTNSEITEDEAKSNEDKIQKLTDKYIAQIDKLLEDKEKEIMNI